MYSDELKRIADIYQPVIRLTQGIILIVHQDGTIVSFNKELESTTGYSYTEIAQKNWFDQFFLKNEKEAAIGEV